MTPSGIGAPAATVPADQQEKRTVSAARDFEALLIAQMLKSMRSEKSAWLGSGDESDGDSNDAVLSLGEQQIAQALSAGGGLGLAKMIETGLTKGTPSSGADR
ncbi:MAG TPA: rod-binding protein [Bryobacteraceae bacterium]|nr:rod-binding protein [Bryobacteraceae bacterium]